MTNNKQQTAVEWYRIKISSLTNDLFKEKISGEQFRTLEKEAYEQAKEMEWDQINNAYLQGFNDNDCNPHEDTFNLYYYEQTYGGNEQ